MCKTSGKSHVDQTQMHVDWFKNNQATDKQYKSVQPDRILKVVCC